MNSNLSVEIHSFYQSIQYSVDSKTPSGTHIRSQELVRPVTINIKVYCSRDSQQNMFIKSKEQDSIKEEANAGLISKKQR